jgi:hypothetical protein
LVPGNKMAQTVPLILISIQRGRMQHSTRVAVSPTGCRGQAGLTPRAGCPQKGEWEPRPRGDAVFDRKQGLISRPIAPRAALPQN